MVSSAGLPLARLQPRSPPHAPPGNLQEHAHGQKPMPEIPHALWQKSIPHAAQPYPGRFSDAAVALDTATRAADTPPAHAIPFTVRLPLPPPATILAPAVTHGGQEASGSAAIPTISHKKSDGRPLKIWGGAGKEARRHGIHAPRNDPVQANASPLFVKIITIKKYLYFRKVKTSFYVGFHLHQAS